MYSHHSKGNASVLKKLEAAGTKVGSNRKSILAAIPPRSHLFEKGLNVKAELYTDLALIT